MRQSALKNSYHMVASMINCATTRGFGRDTMYDDTDDE